MTVHQRLLVRVSKKLHELYQFYGSCVSAYGHIRDRDRFNDYIACKPYIKRLEAIQKRLRKY